MNMYNYNEVVLKQKYKLHIKYYLSKIIIKLGIQKYVKYLNFNL